MAETPLISVEFTQEEDVVYIFSLLALRSRKGIG
jgi:hypothetical protein